MDEFFQNMDMDAAQKAMQRSWDAHMKAFGPILGKAFMGNITARAALTAALNHISRQNIKRGLELLKPLKDHCRCNADLAAWSFFVGLCFEIAGKPELMRRWYLESERFGHSFHLPYTKLAGLYHREARFDEAAKYYKLAAACLGPDNKKLYASLQAGLCSCYTMMHRYDEALEAWKKASDPVAAPGTESYAAILYAAMGEREMCMEYLEALKKSGSSALCDRTRETAKLILEGRHAHFAKAPIDAVAGRHFWLWFAENRQAIAGGDRAALSSCARMLEKVFPFLERKLPDPRLVKGERPALLLTDNYAIGLHFGYASLLELCPPELSMSFGFEIVH